MQKEIVKASQSVEIAQRTADATVKKAEGGISGLLGMKLMEMMDTKNTSETPKKK
jgi:hypothetical protein